MATKKVAKKASPKKASKAAPKKAAVSAQNPKPKLKSANLIAPVIAAARSGQVDITFFSGIGQVTVQLFRHGLVINMQSISNDGSVFFSDIQQGDAVVVNGVCTGTGATITISVPTSPSTPDNVDTGFIHRSYIVL